MLVDFRLLCLAVFKFTALVLDVLLVMMEMVFGGLLLDFLADADCKAGFEAFDRMTKRVFVFSQTEQVIIVARNKSSLKIHLRWSIKEIECSEEIKIQLH